MPGPSPLIIHQFPCLMDNYGYLVHNPDTGETASIDTPEAAPILQACKEKGWTLTHIWNTHHHPDHVGGNHALIEHFGDVEVIGAENDKDRIPGITQGFTHNQSFEFGGHEVNIIDTPGHTLGHIIFYIPSAKAAFVGDTIFVMGCGRLFEGTPADMYESLKRITALPDETLLYCAHEYTLSNAKFAITVEPDNKDLKAAYAEAQVKREQGLPTVPTSVAAEKLINPFVRAENAAQLGEIRRAKDNF